MRGARTWNGYNPKGRLNQLISDLGRIPQKGSSTADLVAQLKSPSPWRVIHVTEDAHELHIHLARRPDALAPHFVFIRSGWRVYRAVAEAWQHYTRAADGQSWEASRNDYGSLEAPQPWRPLLAPILLWWHFRQPFSRRQRYLRQRRRQGR